MPPTVPQDPTPSLAETECPFVSTSQEEPFILQALWQTSASTQLRTLATVRKPRPLKSDAITTNTIWRIIVVFLLLKIEGSTPLIAFELHCVSPSCSSQCEVSRNCAFHCLT